MKAEPIHTLDGLLLNTIKIDSIRRTGLLTLGLLSFSILLIAFPRVQILERATNGSKFVRIEASQYAFTPGEIQVNPGDQVTLELVSTDVVHGLYLDGYNLSVQADPGQTARLSFVASQPGVFRYRCNITCGAMHPFMIGKLTVGANPWFYRGLGFFLLSMVGILIQSNRSGKKHRAFDDRDS